MSLRASRWKWPRATRTRVSAFVLLIASSSGAQLGSGWVETTHTRAIHLDGDTGDDTTYAWSAYQSNCSPEPCADYSYDEQSDLETFQIFDSRSNRSEIRVYNDYTTGSRQFEGYLTFYSPLEDESLMQIWGSTSGATQLMLRGFQANGGELRAGGTVVASGCYGTELKVNVIHLQEDVGNKILVYVDNQLVSEIADNEEVSNYHKYGVYGTTNGNVPAIAEWRAVRSFRDGTTPLDVPPAPYGAYEAEEALLTGVAEESSHEGFSGSGFVPLGGSADGSVEWTVQTEVPGLYSLAFHYSLLGGPVELPLIVNGATADVGATFSSTPDEETWAYASTGLLVLGEGTNTVRLQSVAGNGPNLDHLLLRALEAEDALLSGAAAVPHSTVVGHADYKNPSGDYVQWTVDLESGGTDDLHFRYWLPTGDRPLEISINGSVVSAALDFPHEEGDSWGYVTLPGQTLTSGSNTIRATATGSSGANLDHLVLGPNFGGGVVVGGTGGGAGASGGATGVGGGSTDPSAGAGGTSPSGAGGSAAPDPGTGGAGEGATADEGVPAGCGCRTPRSSPTRANLIGLLAVLLPLFWRVRRRRVER